MRKLNIIILIFWLLSGSMNAVMSSTPIYPDKLKEKFILFTDRNIYAVNEILYFRAFNNSHPLVKEKNWSKVYYIELVNEKGIAAFKGKYLLSQSGADGSFQIPSHIPAGNYFLIGYTKWMRNFSPLDFAFIKLCIINPERPYPDDSRKQSIRNDSASSRRSTPVAIYEDKIKCHVNKPFYSRREQVNLTFTLPKSLIAAPNTYCVAVIKKAAIDSVNFGIIQSGISVNTISSGNSYIPELYGMTLSGRLIAKEDSITCSGANVQLSVLGNKPDYFNTRTDEEGRFIFSLQPTCRKNEMYISFENANPLQSKIILDNDYFSNTFSFPDYSFHLSDDEVQIAEEIMFAMQVNNAFYAPEEHYPCYDTSSSNFYGPPSKSYEMDKFIELPNLQEVFFEIVPEVFIRKRGDSHYFEVVGKVESHPDFTLFKPLVLLDNIPVSNIEELLQISPKKISRIEIVNEIYIKGDNKYGGIINIFSKRGDLAGIRLPEHSMFLNFTGLEPGINSALGKADSLKPYNPDYRNCLLWEPDLSLEPGSESPLNITTSDIPGEYVVLIRGISAKGNIIAGHTTFVVE